jgi:hypothetical protein
MSGTETFPKVSGVDVLPELRRPWSPVSRAEAKYDAAIGASQVLGTTCVADMLSGA